MKNTLLIILSLAFITTLFSACDKGPGVTPTTSSADLPGPGTPLPGTGAGTTPAPGTGGGTVPTGSYQTFTTGSTWRYQHTEGTNTDTTKITVTGKTVTIKSKTFYETTEETGAIKDTSYLHLGNHNYISNSEDYADGVGTEILYLNDTEAVGYTWTGDAVGSNPLISGTYTGKILEKEITKTVLGKTYSGVIHTQVVLNITVFSMPGSVTIDFFVAKNIGIIQIDTLSGTDTTSSKLIDYTIK
jgi:hypothetical protein